MNYYVIVRGPLGVGKSTISRRLARVVNAAYISVDRVLDEYGIWYDGRLNEFLKVNEIVAPRARRLLKKGTPVILDGNFYWKSQIKDLERRLDHRHFVFTLKAPLSLCIDRDAGRKVPHGGTAAREVYEKSTRFDYGVGVDATQPPQRIVREMVSAIASARHDGPG